VRLANNELASHSFLNKHFVLGFSHCFVWFLGLCPLGCPHGHRAGTSKTP
jgi:hypothetical protein